MKKILITAYAVNPYKGSEDGTGWNITSEISKDFKVILITRKNNVPYVKKFLKESSSLHHQNIEVYGFDLPEFVMKLKKRIGERGYVAYYYLWQLKMPGFIKKCGFEFDIAHSLNFHSDSQPNFLWKLGKPTFWGPIGHHPSVKKEFITKHYSWGHYLKDQLYSKLKWLLRNLDPSFRKSVKRSTKIFVINSSVRKVISAPLDKIVSLPAVASIPVTKNALKSNENFVVLTVGRFHYIKGFDLAIESFSYFLNSIPPNQRDKCILRIVGKGEEEPILKCLTKRLGIDKYVEWIEWVDRSRMQEIYSKSDVFLFPSHEGAGMVVAEAMSNALPIICFDNYGPGELVGDAGLKVPIEDYASAVKSFAMHLNHLYANPETLKWLKEKSLKRFYERFTWEEKGAEIKKQYRYAS